MKKPRHRRLLIAIVAAGVVGCADRTPRAFYWPWAKAPDETVQTGPTPKQQIAELRALAKSADVMPAEEHERTALMLAERLAGEQDSILRCEILRTMGTLRSPTAAAMLRAGLEDKDLDVKTTVCEIWGERGDEEAVQVLSDTLTQSTNLDVRLAAARGLGKVKNQAAVEPLGQALDDPDPALQRRAVESLREVTQRDFGNDIVAWRTFVQGGEPARRRPSLVEIWRQWF
jgi:HEAT repeat protein